MAKVPPTFSNNSRGNEGIPDNIIWDENNPPELNLCSGLMNIHRDDCDGNCETKVCTELEVELMNESCEWARAGMSTNNVSRDIFVLGNQVTALINVFKTLVDPAELDVAYQHARLAEMQAIRMASQEAISRTRLGLAPGGQILGPDGNPLSL